MSRSGESARIQQLRDKARQMNEQAQRTTDPEERQRLQEKARKLQDQIEQQRIMGGGDLYPPE